MNMTKQPFLNTYISNLTHTEALESIEGYISVHDKAYIVEVNTDVIVKMEQDTYLQQITRDADMVLVDGQPLIWLSRLYQRPIKEKVSGSDLSLSLCQLSAKKGYSLFILGGKEGIADQAKAKLEKQYPEINIVGTYAPPLGFEHNPTELELTRSIISRCKPDVLLVCLGCPKQEKWIYENYREIDASVFLCAGATVDFLAGNIQRAPKWISDIGLEWFYRFLKEPKRLFKRYFIDDMLIFKLIFKYRP